MPRWRPRWWYGFLDEHPSIASCLMRVRPLLPPVNFITIHYAYFIVVCLGASLVFWGSSNPSRSITYVDSLFLVVSAMTEAGLNTVNLSQMTTWQQIMLFLLIMLGSSIWVSIWTVAARLHVFEQRFEAIVKAEREKNKRSIPLLQRFSTFRKSVTTPVSGPTLPGTGTRLPQTEAPNVNGNVNADADADADADLDNSSTLRPSRRRTASMPDLDGVVQSGQPTSGNDISPALQPPSSSGGHISFAGLARPGTNAGTSTTATSSAYMSESVPVRRQNAQKDQGSSDEKVKSHSWYPQNFLANNRGAGRNGQFHDLTTEEREHLGGCEYRALKVLAVVVPVYFFLWQLLGCVGLGAWMAHNQPNTARENGINPWWLGIFNGVSAFNNSGMSLLDANMIPFQKAYYVLITMGLLILAGNTAYPLFLRLSFWTMLKALERTTADETLRDFKETIRFILKYPRRVYTNLFPSRQTWWLGFMVVLLNAVDWVAFELLNLGNPVIEAIPTGSRVLDGLFQALAVRSGGFYVVPIAEVYIGLQVLYVIMMYISVYPVVITMRHSNVYEERSLGIYADDATAIADGDVIPPPSQHGYSDTMTPATRSSLSRRLSRSDTAQEIGRALRTFAPWHGVGVPVPRHGEAESRISFISQQVHGQLAHDIWWLVLAVLVITTIETSHFLADPVHYSVFNVLFEVVSGYGCVGISTGVPFNAFSFSGGWHWPSKLILCLVMLRGRHRGLPVALDRAVRLPGERLHRDEDEDFRIRRSMTRPRVSVDV